MPKRLIPDLEILAAKAAVSSRLKDLEDFGSDPGALRALIHVPKTAPRGCPLVVVLHGCTQTAAGYDAGSGWSSLADELGFALLFPEQRRANNPNLCFNWFSPADTRRDQGEALSIRQMIATMIRDQGVDPDRVFVTGLSAGGAMASVMLATYPELFAGGAIIAGLPYGAAKGVPEALDRMRGNGLPGSAELDALVRKASMHAGPWPKISVWHGGKDATVSTANADAIVAQWRTLHGVEAVEPTHDMVDGHTRRTWHDPRRGAVIEHYAIAGMGHGTPLRTTGEGSCGTAGPFMLEAGISSTRHIAAFWGLGDIAVTRAEPQTEAAPRAASPRIAGLPIPRVVRPERIHTAQPGPAAGGVQKIIEDALRAAGLMR